MSDKCPTCGQLTRPSGDGRASEWRIRVRLYTIARQYSPVADSDPELALDAPGSLVVRGLPGVAMTLMNMAESHHGAPCEGLDASTLGNKIRGLRPTLSRRGGNAVWRVPYHVNGAHWLARVDIQREESGDA